jgi:hypothetical protein
MNIQMAELSVSEPRLVEVEIAIGKLKSYKSQGSNRIPAKLIKAGGETVCSVIQKLTSSNVIRRNYHSSGMNLLLYQFIEIMIRPTVLIIEESPSDQLPTKFFPAFF